MKIGRFTGTGYSRRTSSEKPPAAESAPKKKALLIGISYPKSSGSGYAPLKGPHGDVAHMRTLLVDRYGYALGDVATLLDSPEGVQPTRANIVRFSFIAILGFTSDTNPANSAAPRNRRVGARGAQSGPVLLSLWVHSYDLDTMLIAGV